MKSSNKVIFNTGILYAQLVVGVVIGLFTTRFILLALGETNYGIYVLVAGIVGMLGILNSNMANTSMRFMAHAIGSGDKEKISRTFNATLFLHFVIGIGVVVLMEIGGIFMFDNLLNIPQEKLFDAKMVFHFMVISTFVMVISVPYEAVINAHENMVVLVLVEIMGHVLKLGIAIYLTYIESNHLILYGLFMVIIQVLLRIVKQWISKNSYDECRIKVKYFLDRKLAKEILSFTGWNLFGSIGALSVTQAKGILLNMFFGVSINAAEGISRSATTQVNMVSVSMTRALNPQLIKSEGSGDRERMLKITEIGTKFSTFLLALFAIPMIFEANFLIKLWLKNVPDYSVIFSQILLANMLLEKFSFQITEAIRAIGNIKKFQLTETFFRVLNIPIAYFALKAGAKPVSIYFVAISVSFFIFFNRLYFGNKVAGVDIKSFMGNGVLPIFFPIIFSLAFGLLIHNHFDEGFVRFFLMSIMNFLSLTLLFWFFGLERREKDKLKTFFYSLFKRLIYFTPWFNYK